MTISKMHLSKLLSKTLFLIFFVFSVFASVQSLDLRPNCGFPGKPYRAKLSPEEKLVYSDGEIVSYQCTDYWAAPQERKCINGAWTGPPARCGDSVRDVLMKDSRTVDMSVDPPHEMWHHTDMNITGRSWKYPNVFTSNRFLKARLRITNDHTYDWFFNFTKPVVKMFVKTNFYFINYTLLPESIRKAHRFDVEVEISPYRKCVLEYQNDNLWKETGNRIDSYFTCEAQSKVNMDKDFEDPPNYMFMRTKSSHNLTHEFIALFFGKAYGNDSDPLCGEPEVDYGQSSRPNVEFKDYVIDCAEKSGWDNVIKSNVLSTSIKCTGDMTYIGHRPSCIPLKGKFCPLDDVFWRSMTHNGNKSTTTAEDQQISLAVAGGGQKVDPSLETGGHKSHPKLAIDSITGYYHYHINDTIYATAGTELAYICLDQENYILVGKDTRKCRTDGSWGGTEPTCRFFESSNKLIESSNSLLIAIFIMGILLVIIITVSCILFVLYTRRLRKKKTELEAEKAEVNAWQNDMNLYDNIELNGSGGGKRLDGDGIYEVYEHVDDQYTAIGNEYTPYNDPGYNNYSYTTMLGENRQAMNQHYGNVANYRSSLAGAATYEELTDGANTDYVRMLRESRVPFSSASLHHTGSVQGRNQGGRVIIVRKDSNKLPKDAEPAYLEISK